MSYVVFCRVRSLSDSDLGYCNMDKGFRSEVYCCNDVEF